VKNVIFSVMEASDNRVLFDRLDDSFLGLLPIQLTGAGFYRALQAILLVDRQPQLARQQHHVSVGIVRKNDGGIAVIVDFPLALLPASVTPALLVHDAHQLALALGKHLCVLDTHRGTVLRHNKPTPQAVGGSVRTLTIIAYLLGFTLSTSMF
jgi:hypothetical protein